MIGGCLEVVTLTYEHERAAHILTLLIAAWVEERGVLVRGGEQRRFAAATLSAALSRMDVIGSPTRRGCVV